ncbi:NFATC2-interacting protein [Periophthalmus magnuspinnatus]|uniref:NFATC2-interacting protein n=1 Tax=Periophthalmus magnuspinnatus TaxID=409849 RepID=UPI00145A9F68|nr:NFATC2-interacting protein [Periophthalmus magnuspinnatus]
MAEPVKPPPKRRRILDPSAIVSVPIYSNQVSNSLQLKAPPFSETTSTEEEVDADDGFWAKFSCETKRHSPDDLQISDPEEEVEPKRATPLNDTDLLRSPSPPPPPESPVQKPSRKAKQKLNEIERRLQAVNSPLSPVNDRKQRRCRRSPRLRDNMDDVIVLSETEDSDVIISSPEQCLLGSPLRGTERRFPLKVRCRTDLHKIPVLPSTPLSAVVEQLSVKLGVPSPRLLLLRQEVELSTEATVGELGLGIADILECMVMAERDMPTGGDAADIIKVRLKGKDRTMAQEFCLRRDAPLGSVFSQFSSGHSVIAQAKFSFHFDGCKLSPHQTPEELDMEDGDIIEVWA